MINYNPEISSTLSVPRQTLKALTANLYDNEGTNVSPIAKDLAKAGLDEDLVSLNLALLLKRPDLCDIPETDKTMRCTHKVLPEGSRWGSTVTVYEFRSFSLLHNTVECVSREFSVINADNSSHPNEIKVSLLNHAYMSYEDWKRLHTSFPEVLLTHINDETDTYFKRTTE